MKAIALESADTPASLIDLPKPAVADDQVRIAIRAASVNGLDVYQASGYLAGMMEHRFPTVVGRDFAGVVDGVGRGVREFSTGDEVFGFIRATPPLESGAFAEFVAGGEGLVLDHKPAGIDFDQAAALPLAGSAALDLLDAIDGKPGDVVLVVGATGGVGSFLVQLASQRGLTVIATARPEEADYIRELGASETVDYANDDVATVVRARHPEGVAALIDLVTRGDALTAIASVVRPGGHVASLLGAADDAQLSALDLVGHNVAVAPTSERLRILGALASSGALRVPIQEVYSIDRVDDALQAFQQGTRGKLIVRV